MPDILTKAEVEELKQHVDDEGCFVDVNLDDRIAHTIEAMAALLEEPCVCHSCAVKRDAMGAWICKPCHDKEAFLATYHGTKGGYDDGK